METGDKTAERLEIGAGKAGNHTHAADDIDWSVFQINCLHQWQFINCYTMMSNCGHIVVLLTIGHPEVPYSLSAVEICLLNVSVHTDGGLVLMM